MAPCWGLVVPYCREALVRNEARSVSLPRRSYSVPSKNGTERTRVRYGQPSKSIIDALCSSIKLFRYGECKFDYVYRAIYAFQEDADDHDVCFFAFHVQEYNAASEPPYAGNVYLAYLDSLNYFQPSDMRKRVYHQILFANMDWVRERGFVRLSLRSLSPHLSSLLCTGESYLFPTRSAGSTEMSPSRLLEWYQELFASAVEKGIIEACTTAREAVSKRLQFRYRGVSE